MTWRTTAQDVREEMEKDGLDLLEQVIVLTMGGVLGGHAYTISQQDFPFAVKGLLYFMILFLGIFVLGLIHAVVSYHRVLQD